MTTGFIDIHTHVLPGIDDGPATVGESLEMLRTAAQAGTTTIAATPHLRSDFPDVHVDQLADRCSELREALDRERVPVQLVSGAEVSLVWALEASDEALGLASYHQRGSDLLIETPVGRIAGLDRLLYELRVRGFRLTLAHPERNLEFQRVLDPLGALVSQGVLLQVNAESLLEPNRRAPIRRLAERLCTLGLAHALASDGHRAVSWRPVTRLAQALTAATALVGSDRAKWMVHAAPAAIIGGQPLPDPPPIGASAGRLRRFGRT